MNFIKKYHNIHVFKKNILISLLIILFNNVFAIEQIVEINSDKQFYLLSTSTYVLIDSSNQLNIDQIICENCPLLFKKNKNSEIHNPHSFYNYWYKINLENKFQTPKSMILEFANSTIPIINIFIKRNSNIYEFRQTGNRFHFNSRDVDNVHFCYQINFAAYEKLTIYAQIQPKGDALNTPIELYDSMTFTKKSNKEGLINGIYYGLMLLTIIISFILIIGFTTISEKSNYNFLGILFFFTLWNANLDGLAFQYIWPSNPCISNLCMYLLPLIGIIFVSLFSDNIKNKEFLNLLLFYIKIIFSLIIILFVIYTVKFDLALIYIHAISLLLGICMLILTFYSWYIQIKWVPQSAKYFIGLFATIIAWLIIISLKTFTEFLSNDFYIYSFKFFLGIQAVILTLLVISKMRVKFTETYYDKLLELNNIVENKTEEINNKSKELSSINKDNSMINTILQKQNKELKSKSDQLQIGINYMKNIQQFLIPKLTINTKLSKQLFSFYKLKDEVSGDLLFVKQINNILYISVIDCSGYGVPAASLSTMVYNYLQNIIEDKNITEPDKIISVLHSQINDLFSSNNNDFFGFDSIDIGISTINIKTNFLNYAGTKIPTWIYTKDELIEFKGDTNSLGDIKSKREYQFTVYSQELQTGDMVYMFTNGYTNQLNDKNEKFMKKNFRILLSEIHSQPITMQRQEIEKRFLNWKANAEQTDDLLIVGLKM